MTPPTPKFDVPPESPRPEVLRAKFAHEIRIGTVETSLWTKERNGFTCFATVGGLVFEHAPGMLLIVPYSNVVSYDIAR
jgi:hypothetical protein